MLQKTAEQSCLYILVEKVEGSRTFKTPARALSYNLIGWGEEWDTGQAGKSHCPEPLDGGKESMIPLI